VPSRIELVAVVDPAVLHVDQTGARPVVEDVRWQQDGGVDGVDPRLVVEAVTDD
jgi:hypothetical protein